MPKSLNPISAAARRKAPGLSLSLGGGWREAMETFGEAAAMAEAGAGDCAREILGEFYAEHRKILVLAEDGHLPEAMVSYSVSLAERLGFDLVLLSVLAERQRSEAQANDADSAPREALAREAHIREAHIREAARPLMEEAARRGVRCAQLIRRGGTDEVLNAVSLEIRRVEFVITRRPESERRNSALLVPEFSLKC
jgi:hypothetical protein